MKKILLIMTTVAIATLSAIGAVTGNPMYVKRVGSGKASNELMQVANHVRQSTGNMRKANTGNCTVAVSLNSIEGYFPSWVALHGENGLGDGTEEFEDGQAEFVITPGTYMINAIFSPQLIDSPEIHIIHEDVVISEDMEVELNAADAVNLIEFNLLTPNGEKVEPALYTLEGEFLENGNAPVVNLQRTIVSSKYGSFATLWGTTNRYKYENGEIVDCKSYFDVRINEVSEDISVAYDYIGMLVSGEMFGGNLGTCANKSVSMVNSLEDYRKFEPSFSNSVSYDENAGLDGISVVKYISGTNDEITGNLTLGLRTDKTTMNLCISNDIPSNQISPMISVGIPESADFESWGDPFKYILSTPVGLNSNGDLEYKAYQYSGGFYPDCYNMIADGGVPYMVCETAFNVSADKMSPMFGNDVPFCVLTPRITYSKDAPDWFVPTLSWGAIGVKGELRQADVDAAKIDLKYNGTTVCDDSSALSDWCWEWFANGEHRGEYELVIDNQNAMVDDMVGRNLTIAKFNTGSDSNCLPPIMTRLQYISSDGFVTDRFDNADDVLIRFAGGLFDFNMSQNYEWMTCRAELPAIKVECAPYTNENYVELSAEVIPEFYSMPGFGHFWQASLNDFNKKSETGWFDLRITMTDEEGNYMTQTISPAFKVESLTSGIDTVTEGSFGVRVNGRDIEAPDGARIFSVNGVSVDGRNLQAGIYFVTLDGQTRKVVVK